MKKLSLVLLIVLSLTIILSLFVDDSTNALYSNSVVNLENSFSTGNFEPTLQEKLDIIIADIVKKGVLEGANQNFYLWNSWSYKIEDYVSGGSNKSNIYGYQNPVSADTPPFYGKVVLRYSFFSSDSKYNNPLMVITCWDDFDYDNVQRLRNFNAYKGSMIIYKPNGNHSISCYVIKANGELGPLQTLEIP